MSECSTLKYCRGVWVFCTGNCKDCEFTSTATPYGNYDLKWVAQTELTEDYITKIIVRCKDCKYFVKNEEVCRLFSNNYEPPVNMTEEDFCSRGERREYAD